MSYYMGDYYPRGDPGIFSFIKGIASKAAGFIPGVGPLISAGISAMPGGSKAGFHAIKPGLPKLIEGATGAMRTVKGAVGSAIVKHPVLSAAGAAGALGAVAGVAGSHLLKHHRGAGKRRRMNSCNPRALRRAVRRLHSFAKHYRHVVAFTSPHPKKGRMYFRKRKTK